MRVLPPGRPTRMEDVFLALVRRDRRRILWGPGGARRQPTGASMWRGRGRDEGAKKKLRGVIFMAPDLPLPLPPRVRWPCAAVRRACLPLDTRGMGQGEGLQ